MTCGDLLSVYSRLITESRPVERLARIHPNTMWTPIMFQRKLGSDQIWLMRCRCGVEKEVSFKNYSNGSSLSCGCYRRALGHRGGNRLAVGESARNQLLLIYRRGAQKRGIEFSLSRDDFLRITSSDCHYCGSPPGKILNRSKYVGKGNGAYIYNGIDRMDSGRGYIADNCVPCCYTCNYAKRDSHYLEFVYWIDRLIAFRCGNKEREE